MTTIITDELKEVLNAADIATTETEMLNTSALLEKCKAEGISAQTAATKICHELDINDLEAYRKLKNELITRRILGS